MSVLAAVEVFVGREPELVALREAWAAVLGGEPRVVWIEGDAGIGKSALIRRFLAEVEDGGFVLRSDGAEEESALPYGVVGQLATRIRQLDGLPLLAAGPPPDAGALAVGTELLRVLGALQETSRVVVVIDDFQWVDLPSAQALAFAVRRLRLDQVLVLAAARPREAARLGDAWTRLAADPTRARRLRLTGLGACELGEFARGLGLEPMSRPAIERLREHTSGHPLHARALLEETPPDVLRSAPSSLPAPRSLADAIVGRVSRLPPAAQDLVAAAAVLGQRCALWSAAAVAAVCDPVAALDDAVAANVLEVTGGAATDAIGFPHPLVRAAVYGDLSPVRVRSLHERAAELGGAESLQHRVAASAGPDAGLAAELEAAAERERDRSAHTTAADFLLAAARVAETAEHREAALLAAIEALVVAGDLDRAASMRGDAEGCIESPLRSYVLGYLALLLGQLDVAEANLSEARAGADEDVAAAAGAQLALLRFVRGQVVDALELANAALRANPSRPGARDVSAYIKMMALVAQGRSAEAERTLAPLPTDYLLDLLVARGTLALQRGDAERARVDLRAAITRAHRGEPLRQVARAHGFLAQAELHLGDWDDALVHAELAVSIAEDSGAPLTYAFAHATASTLSAFRGDLEAAEAYLAAAEVGASALPFWVDIHTVATARARLCLVRSDAPGIVATLEPLDGQIAEYFHNIGMSAPAFLLVEGLIATERVDEGLALLERFDPPTDKRSKSWPALDAARVRGLALAAQGDTDAAAKSFRAGLERGPADSWPLHRARLELAYGTALREKGSPRAVIDVLRAARGRLVRLGARPFLDVCDRELRACGLQPAPDRPDDLLGLTTQERAVVSFVARGLTNREVAAELYVSPKTVEYHLGRVFAKLGVTSRTQLAARFTGAAQHD